MTAARAMSARGTAIEFGRRGAPSRRSVPSVPFREGGVDPAHAALFASLRSEAKGSEEAIATVRDSKAVALVCGLLVGCYLAGLNIENARHAVSALGRATAVMVPPGSTLDQDLFSTRVMPILLAASMLGGIERGCVAVTIAHKALRRMAITSPIAYGVAGGIASALVSALFKAALSRFVGDPAYADLAFGSGVISDAAIGTIAAFCYRAMAGLRRGG